MRYTYFIDSQRSEGVSEEGSQLDPNEIRRSLIRVEEISREDHEGYEGNGNQTNSSSSVLGNNTQEKGEGLTYLIYHYQSKPEDNEVAKVWLETHHPIYDDREETDKENLEGEF